MLITAERDGYFALRAKPALGLYDLHLQTNRNGGRKWHKIGQANYGQANESQEDRWLKIHRSPIAYRGLSRLDVWHDERFGGEGTGWAHTVTRSLLVIENSIDHCFFG